jgi:hypothetical protein
MAKPRIFISSTFYDLRQVREDLDRVVRDLGYEPVRNETGAIPYERHERPESAAYREIELCDILVAVVGGRFGSESQDDPGFSISQAELRRAVERGIQVYVMVERSVHSEYLTYLLNKSTTGVKYRFVDDVRVFEFIEQVLKLPRNNALGTFETASDITAYLKAQWAGLFQRYLQDSVRQTELRLMEEVTTTARTLKDLVTFLTEDRKNNEAVRAILMMNHPAFRRFSELTRTPYRVFFTTRAERDAWLKSRQWTTTDSEFWDADSVEEWGSPKFPDGYLKVTQQLFDASDRLILFTEEDWHDDWVSFVSRTADGDIPF